MSDLSAIVCPSERWYAPGETYCLEDPGSLLPASACPSTDEMAGQAFVRSDTETRFQPLDHCLAYSAFFFPGRRCDGMVLSRSFQHVVFVELKARRRNWLEDAEQQLEATICKIREHDPGCFERAKIRRAYIANRKSRMQPYMNSRAASRIEDFQKKTGFRLVINPIIDLWDVS